MALSGPPAKGTKHGRTPTADWTDVPDVPYTGPSPDLPKLPRRQKWHEDVVAWWEQVRVMAHCVLWAPTDWAYAIQTARYKQQEITDVLNGEFKTTLATEIRRREDNMGYTAEARRKLRIRYVEPAELGLAEGATDSTSVSGEETPSEPGKVTELASRRARLTA